MNGFGVIHRYVVKTVYPGGISKSTIVKCTSVVQFQNPKNLVVLDDASMVTDIDVEVKSGHQKSANK